MISGSNIESFPQLAQWVLSFASASSNQLVRSVESLLKRVFSIESVVPDPYIWPFRDQDSLEGAIRKSQSGSALNLVLWENIGHNCEAFQIVFAFKGLELLKSAIHSLNLKEFVPSAVLARAVLEHTAYFMDKVTYILKNIRRIDFKQGAVTSSPEFEEEIIRTIFGTRLEEGEFKDLPHQSNILNSINRITKSPHPEHQELSKRYAFLCELAHPNVAGNARFWSHVDGVDSEGRQRLVMSRNADSEMTRLITENSLWALGWSAGMLFQSFEDMNEVKLTLQTKLLRTSR